jgi:hypothetical protein
MHRFKDDGTYIMVVRGDGESAVSKLEHTYAQAAIEHLPPGCFIIGRKGDAFCIFNMDSGKEEDETDNGLN